MDHTGLSEIWPIGVLGSFSEITPFIIQYISVITLPSALHNTLGPASLIQVHSLSLEFLLEGAWPAIQIPDSIPTPTQLFPGVELCPALDTYPVYPILNVHSCPDFNKISNALHETYGRAAPRNLKLKSWNLRPSLGGWLHFGSHALHKWMNPWRESYHREFGASHIYHRGYVPTDRFIRQVQIALLMVRSYRSGSKTYFKAGSYKHTTTEIYTFHGLTIYHKEQSGVWSAAQCSPRSQQGRS